MIFNECFEINTNLYFVNPAIRNDNVDFGSLIRVKNGKNVYNANIIVSFQKGDIVFHKHRYGMIGSITIALSKKELTIFFNLYNLNNILLHSQSNSVFISDICRLCLTNKEFYKYFINRVNYFGGVKVSTGVE